MAARSDRLTRSSLRATRSADRRAGNARPRPWRRPSAPARVPAAARTPPRRPAGRARPARPADGNAARSARIRPAAARVTSPPAPAELGGRSSRASRSSIAVRHPRLLAGEEAVRHVEILVDHHPRRRPVLHRSSAPPARSSARSTGSSRRHRPVGRQRRRDQPVQPVLLRDRGAHDPGEQRHLRIRHAPSSKPAAPARLCAEPVAHELVDHRLRPVCASARSGTAPAPRPPGKPCGARAAVPPWRAIRLPPAGARR